MQGGYGAICTLLRRLIIPFLPLQGGGQEGDGASSHSLPSRILLQCAPDGVHNGFSLAQNLVVPEPKYTKAGLLKALIAYPVGLAVLVLGTVNLHDQVSLQANEVEYEVQKWMLPTELEAGNLPCSEMSP